MSQETKRPHSNPQDRIFSVDDEMVYKANLSIDDNERLTKLIEAHGSEYIIFAILCLSSDLKKSVLMNL